MADDKEVSGAEEFVAAEIELAEPLGPEQEKKLRDSFEELDAHGFDSIDIGPKKISLCYDPARTNEEALLGLIKQAGGQIERAENEGSPLL